MNTNNISSGRERDLPPDENGEIKKGPSTALDDLKSEILRTEVLRSEGYAAEARGLSSITSRANLVASALSDPNTPASDKATLNLDQAIAKSWADLDAGDYARLRSVEKKEAALDHIADNMRASPTYAAEIEKRSPHLATAAMFINAEKAELEKQALEIAQAQAEQQAALQAAKDDQEKRRIENLIAEKVRQTLMDSEALARVAGLRKAQTEQVARELVLPGTEGRGSASDVKRVDRITETSKAIGEATDIPRLVRDHLDDLKEIRSDLDKFFARSQIGETAAKNPAYAKELQKADPSVAKDALVDYQEEERRTPAIKRPIKDDELTESLKTRYVVTSQKIGLMRKQQTEFIYRSGNNQGEVAFVDQGKTLSTQRDDKETVRNMIEVAKAKGWDQVTLNGTDEFKRAAWLEAKLSGLEVKGYEPREADIKILQDLQAKSQNASNSIQVQSTSNEAPNRELPKEPITHAQRQQTKHHDPEFQSPSEKELLENARRFVSAKHGEEFAKQTVQELTERLRNQRTYAGILVDHGHANYQFNPDKDRSYFVVLKTPNGEQTVWGKELEKAITHGDVQKGENIVLSQTGKEPVVVDAKVFDKSGQFTGQKEVKSTQKNTWVAETMEKFADRGQSLPPQLATPVLRVQQERTQATPSLQQTQSRPDLER